MALRQRQKLTYLLRLTSQVPPSARRSHSYGDGWTQPRRDSRPVKFRVELRWYGTPVTQDARRNRRVHVCDEVTFDGGWLVCKWGTKQMRGYPAANLEHCQ